ncbi:dimethylaniline monooxygenase [N-oxide-forming] 5 [Strongylocentrotus purpuratus]|uniref:Flavin-containing monooxygenase n=1 Tax=Strongylocentrotus purpuratus TaxID=7668 RepID=A0A7M7HIS0_STRPU|nr:dimethylaniline monooxygenase [N-oxide-forming] 5 [Strongylocentrotus purpuratus]XP_030853382.1 dimethylaniline monooxygenase [N-oxide-forming] 5 [Strongylocentrotus purpuratus]|eukprot:XP_003728397.1 PREDICTED: dimethylaniline monooxygenase [N-oxide-forming] 2 [Strongylocentrotus purpuratus]
MEPVKRVAVIGAGVSGLVSVKACLEEGLEPVCYERNDEIGGIWVYRDKNPNGQTDAAIYEGLVTNSSKEMMCFSDFPFPREWAPYIQGKQLNEYYHAYAKQFDLNRHIHLNTEVLCVEKTKDHDTTGRWSVLVRNQDGTESESLFDAVMVCTSIFNKPFVPTYPGMDVFRGETCHSKDFRKGERFEDKTVLAVGGSHSAGDMAVNSSRFAKQVYLSTRTGTWLANRMQSNGLPRDMTIHRRYMTHVPVNWKLKRFEQDSVQRVDPTLIGIRSSKRYGTTTVMINDDLGTMVLSGKIKTKPGIDHFTETGVVFKDGSTIEELDAVVFATGFQICNPYISHDIVPDRLEDLEMFHFVWPAKEKHHTLAAIGFIMIVGPHAPALELQARWAVQVFKKNVGLPPREVMMKEITGRKMGTFKRFGKHKIQTLPLPYQDIIAGFIGARPDLRSLIFSDPWLAYELFFGPAYPAGYRLFGPHTWSKAREHIARGIDNVVFPTKTRSVETAQSAGSIFRLTVNGFLKTAFMALMIIFILSVLT